MHRVTVALGSNLGDRLAWLRAGVEALRGMGSVVAVSSLYETEPVGGPDQGRYLNAVVALDTELAPRALLAGLQGVEGDSARRREVRWGPRTLDLDIITYADREIDEPGLTVPHPRAHVRRFVLAPLREVAPDVRLADGSTPSQAIESTLDQEIERWEGDWVDGSPSLGREATLWVVGQGLFLLAWVLAALLDARLASVPWTVVGGLIAAAGLGLGVGAIVTFGPGVTASPQPRPGSILLRRGVYGLVRHPMYGAVMLTTLGLAIVAWSPAAIGVAVALAGYLRLKSRREERILAIVFGDYDAYRSTVRKRFLPHIW
ncbi:MAG TPA: 2-amino-4-hydroxy-6-hydroxymethyldihydropteridine diphosphokinase [Acidimicrobiia bacterium]|nr:2-amino-4-hydroxy-6-hydroxymethyldihydropteridine diphosphokinase [Acidimicrobiia bacterium]